MGVLVINVLESRKNKAFGTLYETVTSVVASKVATITAGAFATEIETLARSNLAGNARSLLAPASDAVRLCRNGHLFGK